MGNLTRKTGTITIDIYSATDEHNAVQSFAREVQYDGKTVLMVTTCCQNLFVGLIMKPAIVVILATREMIRSANVGLVVFSPSSSDLSASY